MSLALYRKYRPGSFSELKGQEHVTGPLQQALRNGRIHHAYLFSGPRGCGKTSSARILARSLNCEQGPTPDPCGTCDSCVALAPNGPGSLDVVEIDAASHGGVDDARDLRDRAFYAPVASRYKVYIIDEAHMVSREGFNALLKLVEEPPEFLRFVFATTEPEKVLTTIRSRTHHYPFRLMPRRELTDLLQDVVDKEGIAVDKTVLPLVVRAAQGSARDGLSILDQVLASAGADGVTREAAAGLLGVTPDTLLDDVIDAFAARDSAAVFAAVDLVMERGHDPRRFAQDVLERLRDLVVLDAVADAGAKGLLDCPADQLERMGRQATMMGTAGLSRAADLFHEGLTEMRGTTAPRLLLELVCARVLLPAAATDASSVLTRVERLERRLDIATPAAGSAPVVPPAVAPRPATGSPGTAPPVPPPPMPPPPAASTSSPSHPEPPGSSRAGRADTAAAAEPNVTEQAWPTPAALGGAPGEDAPGEDAPAGAASVGEQAPSGGLDAAAIRRSWDSVLDAVKERKRTTHAQLMDAQVSSVSGRVLQLGFAHAPILRQFIGGTGPDVLKEALRSAIGADLDVQCSVTGAPTPPGPTSGSPGPSAPAGPPYDGFAPGDEAAPEDPDAPAPPEAALHGEAAALRLIESELGGKVVGRVGD
ncbi:MAG: DNA polymerase III subunits gamma/tau [Mycobacteriales bacterium]